MTAVLLALLAALGYGVSDFVGGVASRRVAALRIVIVSYPLSVLLVLVAAPFVGGVVDAASIGWGVASGVAAGVAVWWFYAALAQGPMAVVSPVTAVLVAGIPVLAGLIGGEHPTPPAYVGIVCALVAVVLVSRESPDKVTEEITGGRELRFTRRVALLTVGSGVAFGLTFTFLHETGSAGGLWPLVASRLAATLVVWVAALVTGQFRAPRGEPLRLACYVSLLDVIANVAMLYAFHGSLLSLVSVIGSLYPAATVLLAMVLLGERVGPLQKIGMALALGSVALIAVA
ncbi:drug/metabolite transporter (DMT)-like permease [Nocardia transvalensis]|uniref:Drug/metabolite transporter (DMT)-like permease n=1 Tax=Nocardia transvalensis TaxID=37333 RepID=A0A7W9P9I3_9NOCA|nr:DMT family transporter [Nocardia transvalensis]MBB5912011.1 drug/metabolite transporter (DMT)-like permease [Nocardia transvalensis]